MATIRPGPARVRLATLNAASGRSVDLDPAAGPRPPTPPLDAAAYERALRPLGAGGLGVDVLALQEVDRAQARSHHVDQVAAAARAIGADPAAGVAYAPALVGTPGLERSWIPAPAEALLPGDPGDDTVDDRPLYGVGLVTRLPVVTWHVLRLPAGHGRLLLPVPDPRTGRQRVLTFPDEPRVALAAVLRTPVGPLTVVCTHLSFWLPTALRQVALLRRWAAELPGPVVVAGDLNLHGRVPGLLLRADPLVSGPTYPVGRPRLQLDHLLLLRGRGSSRLEPAPAGAAALAVGDHRGLVGDLTRR